jgi:hypothetical protein
MSWAAVTNWTNGDLITEAKMDAQSTAIQQLQGLLLSATTTLDPPSIAAETVWESGDIAVTGAAVGDAAVACPPATIASGLTWCAYVEASNVVRVRIANVSAGAIDPASATWGIRVIKANP